MGLKGGHVTAEAVSERRTCREKTPGNYSFQHTERMQVSAKIIIVEYCVIQEKEQGTEARVSI